MQIITSILSFCAGLAMFIFGMEMMANGLQQAAGPRAKRLMALFTRNKLTAVLTGALVTAIIQSSSATTVMVVGFVNAQIMNLYQAVGVIMGANIGTTMTGWLVSMNEWGQIFKPSFFAPVLLCAGVILMLAAKKRKNVSTVLIGFGLLFIGLNSMSAAIEPYSEAPIFYQAFTVIGSNPLFGLLVGAVVTAVIQSSSASMGILQTLAFSGMVNWSAAAFIALGQNIGTCVTALLSCIGTSTNAKRAAIIHLLFNVIGSAMIGVAVYVFFLFNQQIAMSHVTGTQLALYHTGFNVATTLILFPFSNMLVHLSEKIIPEKNAEAPKLVQIDKRLLQAPAFALDAVRTEMKDMVTLALENIDRATACLLSNQDCGTLEENEEKLDIYQSELTEFLLELSTTPLSDDEQRQLKKLLFDISHIERVGDLCMDLAKLKTEYTSPIEFGAKDRQAILAMAESCRKALVGTDRNNRPEPAYELLHTGVAENLVLLDSTHLFERMFDHSCALQA